ncbi:hypothetical protein [Marinobacter xiaoshiensis]|uniref:Lipoprotein n=1 Tax=Marinobacter xiaoshiensis TaxID=3073652 RepID=A0ABU2HJC4_9GAMM|nr:hypothetical protein [Marinobacter sp. F60267]MDS1310745.1 hypothetical protein [Marinobacter sp. F60267]
MRYRFPQIGSLIPLLTILAGCSTPHHTNTMVFSTNTKFALDLSVNPAGGTPDFTFGYKRQEVVWMPLLANKNFKKEPPTPINCGEKCMFVGVDGNQTDTYSVLASFGAKFGGKASASGTQETSTSGSGGLAQFFATGLAARNLATEGGARLVSIQGADSDALALAEQNLKYQAREAALIEARLKAEMTPEKYNEVATGVTEKKKVLQAKVAEIIEHITTENKALDKTKWEELVGRTELTNANQSVLTGLGDLTVVRKYLESRAREPSEAEINALHSKIGDFSDDENS